MKYQKINSLFKRDERNIIIPSEYCKNEFKYLENIEWECTEKIDGTNMRVIITPEYGQEFLENAGVWIDIFEGFNVEFRGKSDEAQIPKHLFSKMEELFPIWKINETFGDKYKIQGDVRTPNKTPIILYGEGYGVKIQKGGNYISNGVNFILFDIKVGDIWLKREDIENIACSLGIDVVPFIGYKTIPQAIEYVKKGFISNISENRSYIAEGLVLKTQCGLKDRRGERLITKIKYKDFLDLYRKTPKKYQLYKRVSNTSDSRYDYDIYLETVFDKKEALSKLKEYRISDKTELYFIKEMNSETNEVYHEIFE